MCEAVLETLLYCINEPLLEHKEASLGVLNLSDVQKAARSMGTPCTELCARGACSWAAAGSARMGSEMWWVLGCSGHSGCRGHYDVLLGCSRHCGAVGTGMQWLLARSLACPCWQLCCVLLSSPSACLLCFPYPCLSRVAEMHFNIRVASKHAVLCYYRGGAGKIAKHLAFNTHMWLTLRAVR